MTPTQGMSTDPSASPLSPSEHFALMECVLPLLHTMAESLRRSPSTLPFVLWVDGQFVPTVSAAVAYRLPAPLRNDEFVQRLAAHLRQHIHLLQESDSSDPFRLAWEDNALVLHVVTRPQLSLSAQALRLTPRSKARVVHPDGWRTHLD